MGLIHCSNCGKHISNTIQTCIHCGLTQKNKVEKEQAELRDFAQLSESQQIAYEEEFLKENKKALKFYRFYNERRSVIVLAFYANLIAILIRSMAAYISYGAASGEVYYSEQFSTGIGLTWGLQAISFFAIPYFIIATIICKKSMKRFLYEKKLQYWLKEKYSVYYYPTFSNAEQKRIFDRISDTSIKYF